MRKKIVNDVDLLWIAKNIDFDNGVLENEFGFSYSI